METHYSKISKVFESKLKITPSKITKTKLGENNDNYIVKTLRGKYLFKVFKKSPNHKIYIFQYLINSTTLFPKIITFSNGNEDFEFGYEIQEYIEGNSAWDLILQGKLSFDEYCDNFSKLVNVLHSIPIAKNRSQSIVHGDLAPDNIIIDSHGNYYLIDWDNSKIGNPFEDLAFIFAKGAYFWAYKTPEFRNEILMKYFRKNYSVVNLSENIVLTKLQELIEIKN